MKEVEFNAKAYLKTTRLDKDGAKTATFEFSAKEAVETAKLELMSRDLKNYLPILLNVKVTQAKEQNGKATKIQNPRGIARKD